MQIRKLFTALVPISVLAMASSAFGQTTVTAFAPFSAEPTPGVWFAADVRTGGTASIADLTGLGGNLETAQPLPSGAAKLTTDLTNIAKAEVGVPNNFGTVSDILETISVGFSWYKEDTSGLGGNVFAAPSIKLTFANPVCDDPASASDCYMTLIWEAYQDRHAPVPPTGSWTREDLSADTGGWWSSGGFGTPNGFGGCETVPCPTLRSWYSALSSDFADATLIAVSVGVGSSNQGQIGYFDKVDIAGTLADASYDFDLAPAFETVGECVSTLIADNCAELNGRARANCNHAQQMVCFDLFDIP